MMWILCPGLLVALLLLISGARPHRYGRGGFSVQPWLNIQSLYEPGAKQLFEIKQDQHEESDDEGGPPPGAEE